MGNTPAVSAYVWTPGLGPDPQALQRLRDSAPLPKKPMGEAWFISMDRGMFLGLMHDDPWQWRSDQLGTALFELSSGPGSFGPMREWTVWFDFLLPRAQALIGTDAAQAIEGQSLHGSLASAAFVHYADPILPGRPPHVRRDLLDTLARTMLAPEYWNDGRVVPSCFFAPLSDSWIYGLRFNGRGPFAASCFLVLKYLEPELIDGWFASVIAIDDPYWRAALVIWLAGSTSLILDGEQPATSEEDDQFPASWSNCELVHGAMPKPSLDPTAQVTPFIDSQRRAAFLDSVRHHLNLQLLSQWGEALQPPPDQTLPFDGSRWQYDSAALLVVERYDLR